MCRLVSHHDMLYATNSFIRQVLKCTKYDMVRQPGHQSICVKIVFALMTLASCINNRLFSGLLAAYLMSLVQV